MPIQSPRADQGLPDSWDSKEGHFNHLGKWPGPLQFEPKKVLSSLLSISLLLSLLLFLPLSLFLAPLSWGELAQDFFGIEEYRCFL